MTVAPTIEAHHGFRHEAFVFRDLDVFLDATVDFLAQGIEAGQPVIVAVNPHRQAQLRTALEFALGSKADRVQFFSITELGRNPAALIPALIDFVLTNGADGRPIRAVGEPLSAERSRDEIVECELHEALLNLAIHPDCALWLRCLYDADQWDEETLAEAAASHPILVEDGEYRGSTRYGGAHHAGELFAADLPALAEPDLLFDFYPANVSELDDVVRAHANVCGLDSERSDRLAEAVHRATTNSINHGGGNGCLRIWHQPDAIVLEVEDGGSIRNPLVGRTPPTVGEVGRGLWQLNHLADLVQIRSNDRHTVVRIRDRVSS